MDNVFLVDDDDVVVVVKDGVEDDVSIGCHDGDVGTYVVVSVGRTRGDVVVLVGDDDTAVITRDWLVFALSTKLLNDIGPRSIDNVVCCDGDDNIIVVTVLSSTIIFADETTRSSSSSK